MPKRHRSLLTGYELFFVTTSTRDHLPLFLDPTVRSAVLETLSEVAASHLATIHGYVIMSTHLHMVIACPGGGPTLSRLMRDFKSLVWRRYFSNRAAIWEHRFDDVVIRNEAQIAVKLQYIHNNPVKAGMVERAEEYQHSSARVWLSGFDDHITITEMHAWDRDR